MFAVVQMSANHRPCPFPADPNLYREFLPLIIILELNKLNNRLKLNEMTVMTHLESNWT